jgi:hypothetical protein
MIVYKIWKNGKVDIMRKPLASRIALFTLLYCAAFFLLVVMQFSNKGNFSLSVGAMTVKGRYLQASRLAAEEMSEEEDFAVVEIRDGIQEITGGVKIYYGGLEFNLEELRGKGLTLTGFDGSDQSINPEYKILRDSTVRFGLPGGTILVFSSINTARGAELRISAEFSEDITEVTIPITPRRSSLIRDNGQLGISYSGSRFLFSRPGQYLENGKISLSRETSHISYRSRGRQRTFEPADYIIAEVQNYDSVVSAWREASFTHWEQNAAGLQNEDDIIAFCTEALQRGNYTAAVAAISADFVNSARHSYRSAPFTGGVSNAYRLLVADENEKLNLITRLTGERSLDILKEEHIIDYLYTRSRPILANNVIEMIGGIKPDMLIPDYCPGLLEIYSDMRRWRPAENNPIEHLTEQILLLVSENLYRDTDSGLVFALNYEGMSLEFSLRLGKALVSWAQMARNTEWGAIGRSLILSALTNGGAGRGDLYNILSPGDHYPRATWLSNNDQWAWTASPSVRSSVVDGNMNIAVTFPANMTHYVIISGIRPFNRIQLHGVDWRMDGQFERYDSSGWVYFAQDQILVVKLRHRTAVENIRVIYRVVEPPREETNETET